MSLNDTSWRSPYEAPPAASRMADVRFGNTQDVVVLWSEDEEEISEYVRGLMLIGCITLFLFTMWGIMLCVFMCMGRDRVGFLSGRAFIREDWEAYHDDKPLSSSSSSSPPQQRRGDPCHSLPTRSRVVFVASGLIVIVFSILFVTQGLTKLQNTVDTVNESSVVTQQIAADSRVLITSGLRDLRSSATSVRTTLLNELNRDMFCPADPAFTAAPAADIREDIDTALTILGRLEGFQDDNLAEFEAALLDIQDSAQDVQDTSDNTDFIGWKAMIVVIPYVIITGLLMAATVMAFFDVSMPDLSCCIHWFLMPTFIIITYAACVTAGFTALAAGANSDFCLPDGDDSASPDTNVARIMLADGYEEDDFDFRLIRYITSQCTHEDNPLEPFQAYLPDIQEAKAALTAISETLQNGSQVTELSFYCNREYHAIDSQVDNMAEILNGLSNSLERVLGLVSCPRLVPMYTDTIYDASCDISTKAFFWTFCSAVIVGTFGMVMITLRASFKLSIDLGPTTSGGPDAEQQSSNRSSQHETSVHATPPVQAEKDKVYSDQDYSNGNDGDDDDDDIVTRQAKANAIDVD